MHCQVYDSMIATVMGSHGQLLGSFPNSPLTIIIQDPPFPAKPLHNQGFHPHPDFLLITDHHWEANDVHIDLE